MSEQGLISMGNNVWLIDLLEQGQSCRTGAYVILDDEPTVIDTGSGASHDTLLAGLRRLGIEASDLQYVIVTHVHLDHAGGAGQLMDLATDATLVVHPRGARHMIDPSRLWEGARQVYGDQLETYFGSVRPVAAERVRIQNHEDELCIGRRTLKFFDSPGHAKHHFTILDPVSNALFAGDAVGLRYRTELTKWDFEFIMPSSSPVDFDPAALANTLSLLSKLPFETVYHAHFGASPKKEAIERTLHMAEAFADCAQRTGRSASVPELVRNLEHRITEELVKVGRHPGNFDEIQIDLNLDALGLLHWLNHSTG